MNAQHKKWVLERKEELEKFEIDITDLFGTGSDPIKPFSAETMLAYEKIYPHLEMARPTQ